MNTNRSRLIGLVALLSVCDFANAQAAPAAAAAAPAPAAPFDVLAPRSAADLSVPASPAFAILGLTPTSIQRPGSVRELVASLSKGFDKDGKARNGYALDIAPVPLLDREQIRGGSEYADSLLMQIKARTTFSMATAEADGGSQLAWGLRVGLIDRADPGLYADVFAKCIKAKDVFGGAPPPGPTVGSADDARKAEIKKIVQACEVDTQVKDLWARPALYVGLGQSWFSGTGSLRDKAPALRAFWATYSVGRDVAGYRGLIHLHVERKTDDRVPDKADATQLLRQNTTSLVARMKLGAEKWHAYADLGRTRIDQAGAPKTNSRYSGLGVELRLKEDLWLHAGRSVERGLVDGSSQGKVLAGLRWGDKPLLVAPGPQ